MEDEARHDRGENRRVPMIPLAIGVVLLLFFVQEWVDSSSRLNAAHDSLTEKSKLCLVEWTTKKCDTLKPSGECAGLLECLSAKQDWKSSHLWDNWKYFSEEVLSDFGFPAVVIGILLLI